MAKGFLSFALSAVFVLALLSSAAMLSKQKPSTSYEGYRAALLYELSVKRAFYSSISQAAKSAFAISASTGAEPRAAIRQAVHNQALDFSDQLFSLGYDAIFWCGSPGEEGRKEASERMLAERRAVAPQGTVLLPQCFDSFDASATDRKIHFSNLGFSIYFPSLGIGKAAVFPSGYEVDF